MNLTVCYNTNGPQNFRVSPGSDVVLYPEANRALVGTFNLYCRSIM